MKHDPRLRRELAEAARRRRSLQPIASRRASLPLGFRPIEILMLVVLGLALGLGVSHSIDLLRPQSIGPSDSFWSEPHVLPELPRSRGARRDPIVADHGIERRFEMCTAAGTGDCVLDGATFRLDGQVFRIADIEAPDAQRCPRVAAAARERLRAMLDGGPFSLRRIGREADRRGRKLRLVLRNGRSLGDVLVNEGLARRFAGERIPDCR